MDGILEVNPLRAGGNDRAPRVAPGGCHKCGIVHQRQSMATEQRAEVICLIGKDHLDHGGSLRRIMAHKPRTFPVPERSTGKNSGGEKTLSSPGLPLGGVCVLARYGQAHRQVFGLAGYLLAPASRSMAEPVLISKRLFLLTAAGQFRILTGFPFQPDLAIRHREVLPV